MLTNEYDRYEFIFYILNASYSNYANVGNISKLYFINIIIIEENHLISTSFSNVFH